MDSDPPPAQMEEVEEMSGAKVEEIDLGSPPAAMEAETSGVVEEIDLNAPLPAKDAETPGDIAVEAPPIAAPESEPVNATSAIEPVVMEAKTLPDAASAQPADPLTAGAAAVEAEPLESTEGEEPPAYSETAGEEGTDEGLVEGLDGLELKAVSRPADTNDSAVLVPQVQSPKGSTSDQVIPSTPEAPTTADGGSETPQPETFSTGLNLTKLEQVLERMEETSTHTRDVIHFLKRRAEIEETYAKALRQLYEESANKKVVNFRSFKNKMTRGAAAKGHLELGPSTVNAWSAVENEAVQTSSIHLSLSERINKYAVQPLKSAQELAANKRKEIDKNAQGLAKDLKDAAKGVEKANSAKPTEKKEVLSSIADPKAHAASEVGTLKLRMYL